MVSCIIRLLSVVGSFLTHVHVTESSLQGLGTDHQDEH
jgi:hypothetical protein